MFEYKYVHIYETHRFNIEMNELAKQGWELVSVVAITPSHFDEFVLFLKRKKGE